MSAQIDVRAVNVALGGQPILHSVSLHVPAGSWTTLLGPSGSGKTTLLNVIAGFVTQERGSVMIGDAVVDKVPVHRRDVGIVFQDYALFPHMSVGENVAFPLRAKRMPRARRAELVADALDLVQLTGLAGRRPAELSGGQRQRVALARALVYRPRVLLLDEPLAALDKRLREQMQVELRRIQREVGITTVSVTHDQTEALTISDAVAVMSGGMIEQVDSPQGIYRHPASLSVARFLGEGNFLAVSATGEVDGLGLTVSGVAGPATAMIRPEDLTLAPAATGTGDAVVEAVDFHGSHYRVVVRAERGSRPRLTAWAPPQAAPAIGAHVGLAADVNGLHVLAAADAAEPRVGVSARA